MVFLVFLFCLGITNNSLAQELSSKERFVRLKNTCKKCPKCNKSTSSSSSGSSGYVYPTTSSSSSSSGGYDITSCPVCTNSSSSKDYDVEGCENIKSFYSKLKPKYDLAVSVLPGKIDKFQLDIDTINEKGLFNYTATNTETSKALNDGIGNIIFNLIYFSLPITNDTGFEPVFCYGSISEADSNIIGICNGIRLDESGNISHFGGSFSAVVSK